MMSKFKGYLTSLIPMAIAMEEINKPLGYEFGSFPTLDEESNEIIDALPEQKRPPKGCKEYFFNAQGEFTNGEDGQPHMRRDETIFYCHASNDKNAKRKFYNRLK